MHYLSSVSWTGQDAGDTKCSARHLEVVVAIYHQNLPGFPLPPAI